MIVHHSCEVDFTTDNNGDHSLCFSYALACKPQDHIDELYGLSERLFPRSEAMQSQYITGQSHERQKEGCEKVGQSGGRSGRIPKCSTNLGDSTWKGSVVIEVSQQGLSCCCR